MRSLLIISGQDLEPVLLFRFLEVLSSAYRAGHIQIADYISFLITLLSRYEVFQVFPESSSLDVEKCGKSNSGLFRSVARAVCSCLNQIGGDHLVFKMLEGAVIDQISNKRPLENTCALLRMILTLDSNPTKLSEQSISKLVNVLPGYLIDVVSSFQEEDSGSSKTIHTSKSRYYILPCFLLFHKSENILIDVLNAMRRFISGIDSPTSDGQNCCVMSDEHSSRVIAVVRVLLLIHEDATVWQILLCCEKEIGEILQSIKSYEGYNLNILEKHKIQCAYDQLKTLTGR